MCFVFNIQIFASYTQLPKCRNTKYNTHIGHLTRVLTNFIINSFIVIKLCYVLVMFWHFFLKSNCSKCHSKWILYHVHYKMLTYFQNHINKINCFGAVINVCCEVTWFHSSVGTFSNVFTYCSISVKNATWQWQNKSENSAHEIQLLEFI